MMPLMVKKQINILTKCLLSFLLIIVIASCSSKGDIKDTDLPEAEKTFIEANEKLKAKDYEGATELFEKVRITDRTLKFSTIAQVRLADILFEQALYDEASFKYEDFLSLHPYNKYAPYAQFQLAMSFYKQITTIDVSYSLALRAMKEFRKLQQNYPRNPYIDVTEIRIDKCLSILADHELYVGKFYFEKGSYKAASNRFNDLLERYPDSRNEAEASYYLGRSYKNLGENDKALNTLTALIEKFPATKLAKEAEDIITSLNNNE
jgi:outer membrane protein assembly factor BamD